MSPKKWAYLLLLLFLPIDGTDLLRLPLGDLRIAPTDVLLVFALFFDFLDATLIGVHLPRFAGRIGILAFLIAVFSAVSLLYVPGVGFEYDVKMSLVFLELLAVLWLTVRCVNDVRMVRLALSAITFGALLVGIATIAKSAGVDLPGEVRTSAKWRIGPFLVGVTGLEGAGLSAGMALLTALPAVLVPGVLRLRWLRWPLAFVLSFSGVLIYSRSLWVALAVEAFVLIAAAAFFESRPLRTTVTLLFVATGSALLLARAQEIVDALVRLRPQTVASRLAGYEHALDLATATTIELLFGAGKGYFAATFAIVGVPHNFMLDILVAKGLLALSTFLLLVAAVTWKLGRLALRGADGETRRAALALLGGLAGILANGLFEPITTSMTFLVVIALATALASIEPTRSATPVSGSVIAPPAPAPAT